MTVCVASDIILPSRRHLARLRGGSLGSSLEMLVVFWGGSLNTGKRCDYVFTYVVHTTGIEGVKRIGRAEMA